MYIGLYIYVYAYVCRSMCVNTGVCVTGMHVGMSRCVCGYACVWWVYRHVCIRVCVKGYVYICVLVCA